LVTSSKAHDSQFLVCHVALNSSFPFLEGPAGDKIPFSQRGVP
jgi:hypothetical protein